MKIWIGRRESDILTYCPCIFDYSITYYGCNDQKHNFAYCNHHRTCAQYDNSFFSFVNNCIKKVSERNTDFEIYFYNNLIGKQLEQVNPDLKKHYRNYNDYDLLNWLNNKSYTRFWLSNTIEVPPFALLSNLECTWNSLHKKFPNYSEYIIQRNYSSGGEGTYHLTYDNEAKILNQLCFTEPYLVSPFLSNTISACCHVIIGKENNLIFPIGFQIIDNKKENMKYLGTSFKADVRESLNYKAIYNFIEVISKKLSKMGYRGICGYDFLIRGKDIFLIEINPRYMASSYLINHVLQSNNLPSLFELNDMAFTKDILLIKYKKEIINLKIPFTTFTQYFFSELNLNLPISPLLYFDDGLKHANTYEKGSYLYRYITE